MMLEAVTIGIDMLSQPMVLERSTGGTYSSGGTWSGTWSAPENIAGVIEPVTGRDLKDMPEGIRSEAVALLFVKVSAVNGIAVNDRVTADAVSYRVIHIDEWTRYGGFHECVLGKIKTP